MTPDAPGSTTGNVRATHLDAAIRIRLPEAELARLREIAAASDLSIAQVIRRAIRAWMANHEETEAA